MFWILKQFLSFIFHHLFQQPLTNFYWSMSFHAWYFFLLVHISKPDNMSKGRASLPNNGKNMTARVLTPGSGLSSSNDLLRVSRETVVSWENGYKQYFGKSNKHIKHFPYNRLAATQGLIKCDAVQLGDVNPDQCDDSSKDATSSSLFPAQHTNPEVCHLWLPPETDNTHMSTACPDPSFERQFHQPN